VYFSADEVVNTVSSRHSSVDVTSTDKLVTFAADDDDFALGAEGQSVFTLGTRLCRLYVSF